MKRGLRKFHAGFPRSCCLTISYSKLKFVTYINVCFLIFGFETKKVFISTKKTVRSLKFKFKLFYGLEKGRKARGDGTSFTVQMLV